MRILQRLYVPTSIHILIVIYAKCSPGLHQSLSENKRVRGHAVKNLGCGSYQSEFVQVVLCHFVNITFYRTVGYVATSLRACNLPPNSSRMQWWMRMVREKHLQVGMGWPYQVGKNHEKRMVFVSSFRTY